MTDSYAAQVIARGARHAALIAYARDCERTALDVDNDATAHHLRQEAAAARLAAHALRDGESA